MHGSVEKRLAKKNPGGIRNPPMSIRPLALLVLLLGAMAFASPVRAGVPAAGFEETVFQGGLTTPVAIAFLPDGRMLIAEKGGALKLSDGSSVSTLVTIVTARNGALESRSTRTSQ